VESKQATDPVNISGGGVDGDRLGAIHVILC
jgi:hypothetical protein